MDLESAATELYGAPLAEFVAVRTRLEKDARTAGDRQLASDLRALRKPSQAAWAVNQIVRQSPELVDDLIDLGDELRTAQQTGDSTELRRLTDRRHSLQKRLRRRTEELVASDGRTLGAAAAQALERTVGAAMSDTAAAEVVRSGLLVVDLENAGWGMVDLDGAQATGPASPTGTAPQRTPTRGRPRQDGAAARREAEQAQAEAEEDAARAATELDRAQDALDAAAEEERRLADQKAALLAELEQVDAGEQRAAHEVRSARRARAAAQREADRTARLAARAREKVDDLARRV